MRSDLINKIPAAPDVAPPMFEGLQSAMIDKLAEAKAKADATLRNAPKLSKNPFFNSEYADLDVITRIVRPIYGEHGLAIVQAPWVVDEKLVLITTLTHESGQWMRSMINIAPIPDKNGNITPQAVGSALSFGKRYSLAAMANIAQTNEDDDGELASENADRELDEADPVAPTAPTAVAVAAPVSSSTGEVAVISSPAATSPRDLSDIDIVQALEAVSSASELQEWKRDNGAEMSDLKEHDPPLFEELKTIGKFKESAYG
jgi:hypothetical protein